MAAVAGSTLASDAGGALGQRGGPALAAALSAPIATAPGLPRPPSGPLQAIAAHGLFVEAAVRLIARRQQDELQRPHDRFATAAAHLEQNTAHDGDGDSSVRIFRRVHGHQALELRVTLLSAVSRDTSLMYPLMLHPRTQPRSP